MEILNENEISGNGGSTFIFVVKEQNVRDDDETLESLKEYDAC